MNISNFKFQIPNTKSHWKLNIGNWILEIPAKRQEGFIALTTVLLLLAVTVGIAISVTYSSIGEAQSGLTLFKGEENLHFIEGCVEDVMLKIRSNASYSSTSFTHEGQTCTITYNSGGPTNWNLTVSSSSTTYQRKIQVIFTRGSSGITLTSWKEI